jgi:2-(1,2-epoxy-1,2-dihydrophenyl)acetyl-CoA isomerase
MPFGTGGTYDSAEAMWRQGWREIGRHVVVEAKPDRIHAFGIDGALVTGTYVGTSRQSGATLLARFAHVIRFEDGRMSSLEQFTDTAMWHQATEPELS